MIRFENQKIRFAEMVFHQFGHVTEIGDDRHLRSIHSEGVADGIGGVVRNRERADFDVADFESHARADVLDMIDARFRARFLGPSSYILCISRYVGSVR